jgi:hypothetical protein
VLLALIQGVQSVDKRSGTSAIAVAENGWFRRNGAASGDLCGIRGGSGRKGEPAECDQVGAVMQIQRRAEHWTNGRGSRKFTLKIMLRGQAAATDSLDTEENVRSPADKIKS